MKKNISISLDDYLSNFISDEIKSGRYKSINDVIKSALKLLEKKAKNKDDLIKELELGENSKKISNFNANSHLNSLHEKYL